jgi:hypothetical protein
MFLGSEDAGAKKVEGNLASDIGLRWSRGRASARSALAGAAGGGLIPLVSSRPNRTEWLVQPPRPESSLYDNRADRGAFRNRLTPQVFGAG